MALTVPVVLGLALVAAAGAGLMAYGIAGWRIRKNRAKVAPPVPKKPLYDVAGGWKVHVEERRCDHCGGGPATTKREYAAASAYFQAAPTVPHGGFIERRFARAL